MARINLDQLIQEMTPEQKILAQQFYANFDNGTAVNRRIVNVVPLMYIGAQAGSEFLTYAATKLYLCLFLEMAYNGAVANDPLITTLADQANNTSFSLTDQIGYYDAGAPSRRFYGNNINIKNIYFSRINATNYTYVSFIGYRITLA